MTESEKVRPGALPREAEVLTETRSLDQRAFDGFAAVSGDDNPIHVDPSFAAGTRFGRPVAHGMLLYGLVCRAVRRAWPGAVQEQQDLMFPAPARAGNAVHICVEFTHVDGGDRRASCDTMITRDDGETVCRGQAVFAWERDDGEGGAP